VCPTDLPLPLTAALRREVGLLRRDERRRQFPLGVHVGRPGGPRTSARVPWPVPDLYDAGLRLDLLDALLSNLEDGIEDSTAGFSIWLTRPGTTEQHDLDITWWSSASHACSARGLAPSGFFVVTRYGWLDLDSGASRTWKRLRL
jgi:hypothetical protein